MSGGRVRKALPSTVPGLVFLVLLAALAHVVGTTLGVNVLVLAVLVGVVVGNVAGTPAWAAAGADEHKLVLETGIVLLGAQLAIGDVLASGPRVVLVVCLGVVVAVGSVELLGRRVFALRDRATSLLAAGAGICGVSAVVAVAGAIDADGEDIAAATGTILLFDAVTLLLFPVVGDVLGLTGRQFGVWAGVSMFSTGPVTAAGFAVGEVAGQWATLTKLVRNALIGVVAVGYSLAYVSRDADAVSPRAVWSRFPKFLVGFAAVSAVASLGLLSPAAQASLDTLSTALFTVAFVGLGLDIRLARMRETGLAPVAVVAGGLLVVSGLALVVVTTVL